MAFIDGLDVPDELLSLFNKFLSVLNGGASLGLKYYPSSVNRARNRTLYTASLFVLWQSLYDGFTSDRRAAWDLYWTTLPFSSHSGANGWPGSGYSAFVYVNAPRKRAGLSLLYDPPFVNLVYNGDFAAEADGWDFEGAYLDAGGARFDAGSDFPFFIGDGSHPFTILSGGSYRIEADIDTSGGDFELDLYSNEISDFVYTRTIADFSGHYSEDYDVGTGGGDCVFAALAHEDCAAFIDNISVVAL